MTRQDRFSVDPDSVPHVVVPPPGPRSKEVYAKAHEHRQGFSSQARLFPLAFESGHGLTLRDVDRNA